MADLTRVGKNNQKREAVFAVSDVLDAVNGDLFNLPANILVISVTVIEVTGGTAAGTVSGAAAGTYYADGTLVSVSGVTGKERVVVEYLELDTVTGDLTNV